MTAKPKPRKPLSRERIVNTAIALVDAEGLDALTMRRLGAKLGMDPMAVYYYVPNKAALLDAVVEAVMAEIDLGVDDPSSRPRSGSSAPPRPTQRCSSVTGTPCRYSWSVALPRPRPSRRSRSWSPSFAAAAYRPSTRSPGCTS